MCKSRVSKKIKNKLFLAIRIFSAWYLICTFSNYQYNIDFNLLNNLPIINFNDESTICSKCLSGCYNWERYDTALIIQIK